MLTCLRSIEQTCFRINYCLKCREGFSFCLCCWECWSAPCPNRYGATIASSLRLTLLRTENLHIALLITRMLPIQANYFWVTTGLWESQDLLVPGVRVLIQSLKPLDHPFFVILPSTAEKSLQDVLESDGANVILVGSASLASIHSFIVRAHCSGIQSRSRLPSWRLLDSSSLELDEVC